MANGLNADRLDGLNAIDIINQARAGLGAPPLQTIAQSLDTSGFLPIDGKAADSDLLDGLDATDFLGATEKAADADQLDGLDSTAFLAATGTAADADQLDGLDSTAFLPAGRVISGSLRLDVTDSIDNLMDAEGVGLYADCDDVGGGVPGVTLEATTDEDDTWAAGSAPGVAPAPLDMTASVPPSAFFATDAGAVHPLSSVDISVTKPSGATITGSLAVGFDIHGADCTVEGSLLVRPAP